MARPNAPSSWRAERNDRSRERLRRALPPVFPPAVLVHALARPLVPPLPRLSVESYWRAHPFRADRLARALAARSGCPPGWTWRLSGGGEGGRPGSLRVPPAPFREAAFSRGPGWCRVCGQPVFRFGWHVDLWGEGSLNRRASWHACCVAAWKFWTAPADQARLLRRLSARRCAESGRRLLADAEIDHRVPLFQVWRDRAIHPWPDLLAFWGLPNLRALNRGAHAGKCAAEAALRTGRAPSTAA